MLELHGAKATLAEVCLNCVMVRVVRWQACSSDAAVWDSSPGRTFLSLLTKHVNAPLSSSLSSRCRCIAETRVGGKADEHKKCGVALGRAPVPSFLCSFILCKPLCLYPLCLLNALHLSLLHHTLAMCLC